MKLMRFAVAVLAITAAVSGCQLKDDSSSAPPTDGPPPIPAPADVKAPPPDTLKTASGLAYKIITVGMGSIHPTPQHRAKVHYTGWTTDGRMFESTYQSGRPAEFFVNKVVPGWTEMLQLMVVGEKVRVWIPPALAYEGSPTRPQGMLVFEIELLDIR